MTLYTEVPITGLFAPTAPVTRAHIYAPDVPRYLNTSTPTAAEARDVSVGVDFSLSRIERVGDVFRTAAQAGGRMYGCIVQGVGSTVWLWVQMPDGSYQWIAARPRGWWGYEQNNVNSPVYYLDNNIFEAAWNPGKILITGPTAPYDAFNDKMRNIHFRHSILLGGWASGGYGNQNPAAGAVYVLGNIKFLDCSLLGGGYWNGYLTGPNDDIEYDGCLFAGDGKVGEGISLVFSLANRKLPSWQSVKITNCTFVHPKRLNGSIYPYTFYGLMPPDLVVDDNTYILPDFTLPVGGIDDVAIALQEWKDESGVTRSKFWTVGQWRAAGRDVHSQFITGSEAQQIIYRSYPVPELNRMHVVAINPQRLNTVPFPPSIPAGNHPYRPVRAYSNYQTGNVLNTHNGVELPGNYTPLEGDPPLPANLEPLVSTFVVGAVVMNTADQAVIGGIVAEQAATKTAAQAAVTSALDDGNEAVATAVASALTSLRAEKDATIATLNTDNLTLTTERDDLLADNEAQHQEILALQALLSGVGDPEAIAELTTQLGQANAAKMVLQLLINQRKAVLIALQMADDAVFNAATPDGG